MPWTAIGNTAAPTREIQHAPGDRVELSCRRVGQPDAGGGDGAEDVNVLLRPSPGDQGDLLRRLGVARDRGVGVAPEDRRDLGAEVGGSSNRSHQRRLGCAQIDCGRGVGGRGGGRVGGRRHSPGRGHRRLADYPQADVIRRSPWPGPGAGRRSWPTR